MSFLDVFLFLNIRVFSCFYEKSSEVHKEKNVRVHRFSLSKRNHTCRSGSINFRTCETTFQ